jgi:hypothetical protein
MPMSALTFEASWNPDDGRVTFSSEAFDPAKPDTQSLLSDYFPRDVGSFTHSVAELEATEAFGNPSRRDSQYAALSEPSLSDYELYLRDTSRLDGLRPQKLNTQAAKNLKLKLSNVDRTPRASNVWNTFAN